MDGYQGGRLLAEGSTVDYNYQECQSHVRLPSFSAFCASAGHRSGSIHGRRAGRAALPAFQRTVSAPPPIDELSIFRDYAWMPRELRRIKGKGHQYDCGCASSGNTTVDSAADEEDDAFGEMALLASGPARDWSESFPLGNGAMGALVGFELFRMRIPLAEETLFETREAVEAQAKRDRDEAERHRAERFRRGRATLDDRQWEQRPKTPLEAFQKARKALLNNDVKRAHEMTRWLDEGPVASFEGLATLDILSLGGNYRPADGDPFDFADAEHEEAALYQHFDYARTLDLDVGVARAQFKLRNNNSGEVEVHEREAFVSAPNNVLVLRFDCRLRQLGDLDAGGAGCARLTVGLSRQRRSEVFVDGETLILKSLAQSDDDRQKLSFVACARIVEDKSRPVSLQKKNLTRSDVQLRAAPLHSKDAASLRGGTEDNEPMLTASLRPPLFSEDRGKENDDKSPVFISAASSSALVLLATGVTSYRNWGNSLQSECKARLSRASGWSYNKLRERHTVDFMGHFGKAKFSLGASSVLRPALSQCHRRPARSSASRSFKSTADRIEELGESCAHFVPPTDNVSNATKQESRIVDPPLLALAYNYARYLLLSSSRGPDGLPANLQGVWADGLKAPWAGDYHLNINLEMAYWSAMASNLQISAEPLFHFVDRLAAKGEEIARQWYGIDGGWVAHGFTDISADARALGENHWALCVTCGAWAALATYEASEMAPTNQTLLSQAMLQLQGASRFFTKYLMRHNDTATQQEVFVTGPTTSPENSYRYLLQNTSNGRKKYGWGTIALAPAIDIAILSRLFEAYREGCARILSTRIDTDTIKFKKCDYEVLQAASAANEKLPNGGVPVACADGVMLREFPLNGDAIDCLPDAGHRHFSGLWALMPGRQISPIDTVSLALKANATLRRKLSAGGGHTGWSRAWAASLAARLHDRDAVEMHLLELVSEYCASNLLATHPRLKPNDRLKNEGCVTCFERDNSHADTKGSGRMSRLRRRTANGQEGMITTTGDVFQIDGNLGLVAAVNEALIQSHRGPLTRVELHLLPALPPSWTHGEVIGLRVRGGFEVDMKWANSELISIGLKVIDAFASSVALRSTSHLTITEFYYKQSSQKGKDSKRIPALFTPQPGVTVIKPIFVDCVITFEPVTEIERQKIEKQRQNFTDDQNALRFGTQ